MLQNCPTATPLCTPANLNAALHLGIGFFERVRNAAEGVPYRFRRKAAVGILDMLQRQRFEQYIALAATLKTEKRLFELPRRRAAKFAMHPVLCQHIQQRKVHELVEIFGPPRQRMAGRQDATVSQFAIVQNCPAAAGAPD